MFSYHEMKQGVNVDVVVTIDKNRRSKNFLSILHIIMNYGLIGILIPHELAPVHFIRSLQ